MADKMSIDRKDHADREKDDSEDSMGSSPEVDAPPAQNSGNPAENQQPKRKGGRKPVSSFLPLHSLLTFPVPPCRAGRSTRCLNCDKKQI
jgi:hypothetical protein